MQFAVAGSFAHSALWGRLLPGLVWAFGFALAGLAVFGVKTRSRHH